MIFKKFSYIGMATFFATLVVGCSDGSTSEEPVDGDLHLPDTLSTTSRRRPGGGSCPGVPSGQTLIHATVIIEAPDFQKNGHEHVRAKIVSTTSVGSPQAVTTPEVELAMVLARGGTVGLPSELPLTVGQTIDVQGVYVPKEQAYGTNHQWAVIHFTHAPCGFATIGGTTYQ